MPVNGSGRFIGPGHPIRDGLILWLDPRYKETNLVTGGNWVDMSGLNRTVSPINDPEWSYGYYFEFDGTDQGFQATNMMGGTLTNFTLEIWSNRDDSSGNEYYLDGRNAGASTDSSNWWFLSEYNSYDTNFRNLAFVNWSNGYTNWHQALVTDDNSTSRLYINGEEVDTGNSSTWNSNDLTIGMRMNTTSGGGQWNGKFGIVRIYDRVLSATEARHNFQTDAGRFDILIEGTS
mgnify:FL=1